MTERTGKLGNNNTHGNTFRQTGSDRKIQTRRKGNNILKTRPKNGLTDRHKLMNLVTETRRITFKQRGSHRKIQTVRIGNCLLKQTVKRHKRQTDRRTDSAAEINRFPVDRWAVQ